MNRFVLVALLIAAPVLAQDSTTGRGGGGRARRRRRGLEWRDGQRARPPTLRQQGSEGSCGLRRGVRAPDRRQEEDGQRLRGEGAAGKYEFQKIKYKSRADGLEIPAYLFSPIDKGDREARRAGVGARRRARRLGHGHVSVRREAVQRGYVIITPDYRGSTGYGDECYRRSTTAARKWTTCCRPSTT